MNVRMSERFPIRPTEHPRARIRIAAIEEGLTFHHWILKTLEQRVGGEANNRTTSRKRGSTNERTNRHR